MPICAGLKCSSVGLMRSRVAASGKSSPVQSRAATFAAPADEIGIATSSERASRSSRPGQRKIRHCLLLNLSVVARYSSILAMLSVSFVGTPRRYSEGVLFFAFRLRLYWIEAYWCSTAAAALKGRLFLQNTVQLSFHSSHSEVPDHGCYG